MENTYLSLEELELYEAVQSSEFTFSEREPTEEELEQARQLLNKHINFVGTEYQFPKSLPN